MKGGCNEEYSEQIPEKRLHVRAGVETATECLPTTSGSLSCDDTAQDKQKASVGKQPLTVSINVSKGHVDSADDASEP